jgi:BASS family bile acid:Na+ symporter
MPPIKQLLLRLAESYLVIFGVAITAGLLWPGLFAGLSPYLTWMLAVVFFLNSLRIDMRDVLRDLHEWKLIGAGVAWMLVGLPVVAWFAMLPLWPEMALPYLLLSAMPAGTTLPLLVEIIGGRPSLALIFTVVSSALAPFTIPLVIWLLAGHAVQVNTLDMFAKLFVIIVVPFLLAQGLLLVQARRVRAARRPVKAVVVVLLALIIATVVAQQAHAITGGRPSADFLWNLLAVTGLFAFFAVSGWFLAVGKSPKEKLTMSMSVTGSNFTLAIYLASAYFPEPATVVPVILSVIPWTLFIVPYKILAGFMDAAGDRRRWWRLLRPKRLT